MGRTLALAAAVAMVLIAGSFGISPPARAQIGFDFGFGLGAPHHDGDLPYYRPDYRQTPPVYGRPVRRLRCGPPVRIRYWNGRRWLVRTERRCRPR